KPELFILVQNEDGLNLLEDIKYPSITYVNGNENIEGFFVKYLRKIIRRLTGKDYWLKAKLKDVKYVFECNERLKFIPNQYYWVQDFQEFRLPNFFSKEEASKRSSIPRKVSQL